MEENRERMVEPSMDEMCKSFHNAHVVLEDTIGVARGIRKTLADGALVGQAGDEFCDAISVLIPKIRRLAEKLEEQEHDVREAVRRIRNAEDRAERRFQ
jgi:hypothetical protein